MVVISGDDGHALREYRHRGPQPAACGGDGSRREKRHTRGKEAPWDIGEFYGSSYFVSPRGKILAQASRDKDELLITDLNFDEIKEVRDLWQFYRDRRPETYGALTAL